MKKIIKNVFFIFLILISFFFCTVKVNANSINKIEMDVYIDSYANAYVVEVWDTYLNQGTEGYRTYTNLGDATISNFTVSDESGRIYENLSSWNTSDSFSNKAYKSGLKDIYNGVELCWGISKYGRRTYTLKYYINNFVTQYTDAQGIYFNFLNLDQSVDDVKITIHSEFPFSVKNSKIWAFGYEGSINFVDGKIVLESNGFLSKSQYMVGLIKFETDFFSTLSASNSSFEDIYNSAFADVEEESDKSDEDSVMSQFLTFLLYGIGCVIIFVFFFHFLAIIRKILKKLDEEIETETEYISLNSGIYDNKLPKDSDINYWREIPCNKNLDRAYWIALNYNIVSSGTLEEGIIGAILLKWVKEGLITVIETKESLFNKNNNYAIDFSKMEYTTNETENALFELIKKAAGENQLLEPNEFEKWCKRNWGKMQEWYDNINLFEQQRLENKKLIEVRETPTYEEYDKPKVKPIKRYHSSLREDAIRIKGLKKFLLDFSIISKREHFEVHIWEDYLIFAQLLGIANRVEKQFRKFYPNFDGQTKFNFNMTTSRVSDIAYRGHRGYSISSYLSSSSGSSSSSSGGSSGGGGGSSSSSGGGSSGGSSGGGFR